jgi:hypothetical protein
VDGRGDDFRVVRQDDNHDLRHWTLRFLGWLHGWAPFKRVQERHVYGTGSRRDAFAVAPVSRAVLGSLCRRRSGVLGSPARQRESGMLTGCIRSVGTSSCLAVPRGRTAQFRRC